MGARATTMIRGVGAPLPAHLDKIVIYDGVCNLCNGTVKFLIKRDPAKVFKFVALQSDAARPLLEHFNLSREEALQSIVFVDSQIAYRKSAAALQISAYLPQPYKFLYLASCVPAPLRDVVYDCVAVNRYRVFGQSEECMRPTPDIMARFLDAEEMKAARRRKPADASITAGAGAAAGAGAGSAAAEPGVAAAAAGLKAE
jgi:predicted DCC family thiol-disulfide oxidoreductase YuxK